VPTSPTTSIPVATVEGRVPLRLELDDDPVGFLHGAWWPQSRDLQPEAADLVDHFPAAVGRINRLLISRPDWDNPAADGRALRRIVARRGPIKVGSFPSDDTHLMILTMATGRRLRLVVVPSDLDDAEGARRMRAVAEHGMPAGTDADWDRWDDETPAH
jgi:hypothetical protein